MAMFSWILQSCCLEDRWIRLDPAEPLAQEQIDLAEDLCQAVVKQGPLCCALGETKKL